MIGKNNNYSLTKNLDVSKNNEINWESKKGSDFASFLREQTNKNLHLNLFTNKQDESDTKSQNILLYKNMSKEELALMLAKCLIKIEGDIVVINKPNGISVEGSGIHCFSILDVIPQLSKILNLKENLHIVHRLDKDTTGVLLLAKNHDMAFLLKDAFKRRQIRKNYLCLTHGVPYPKEGIIDFPLKEINVNDHTMISPDMKYINNRERKKDENSSICTTYKTLCDNYNIALVQCSILCGVKHQIRAHISYGLDTPILGDHKYAWFIKSKKYPIMPQILSPPALAGLKILPTKTRYIPIHLHAHQILISDCNKSSKGIHETRLKNMQFHADIPRFFLDSLCKLKLFDSKLIKSAMKRIF